MTLQQLRVHAITQTLFPPAHLKAAIQRLGFVQADPIRSPARAQDLILSQRVKGYRAGDLEPISIWRKTFSTPTALCLALSGSCCIPAKQVD